jgi:hypothetical protein
VEDATLYSPVKSVIWTFAEATANSFEFEYGQKTIEWGRKIVDVRAAATVKAIREAMMAKP